MFIGSQQHLDMDSFRESSGGKRIVLLYPWTHYRTLFLKKYLQRACEGLLYYRARGENISLVDWLRDLAAEFRHVFPSFGEKLLEACEGGSAAAMGHALADEIMRTSSDPLIMFIDDFDRIAVNGQFNEFLQALTDSLPEHVQIALSSSMVPAQPWNALIRQGDAVVLGNHLHRSDIYFNSEPQPKPQIEVSAFGVGTVSVNGKPIPAWDGLLPKRLFFYLMDNPLVSRDQIFADFWPHLTVKGATDIFHVTKHKISEIIGRSLGQSYECELTSYKQGFYIPNEALVRHYDVENFTDAFDRAYLTTDPHEVELFLTRAIDLYRDDFLTGSSQDWINRRRDELRRKYSEALIWLAHMAFDRRDDVQAQELFVQAKQLRPEREDIRRRLVELLLRAGEASAAREEFDALQRDIYEPLGIEMSAETAALQRQLVL